MRREGNGDIRQLFCHVHKDIHLMEADICSPNTIGAFLLPCISRQRITAVEIEGKTKGCL